MARRLFAIVTCLAGLTGIVWLPLDAQEKSAGLEIVAKLKGHTDAVYAVAYSPDGKFLATASFDNTLKLWDPATGKEIRTYGGATGHNKQVISVAFNQDGSMLASGSTDGTLKVWDVPVNAPIRSLKFNDAVQAVALSPDGTKLAIGGRDGSMKLVTPTEFKEIVKFEPGHQGAVTSLSFNGNGQVLASTGVDRTLRYWNVLTGQLLTTIGAHTAGVNSVAVNPNNTAAYTVGDDGFLKFWSWTPAPSKTVPGHAAPIRVMALAADGAQYYTGSDDKTVRHFTVAGAKEVRALTGPAAPITSVATHPVNAFIAVGTQDSRVFMWNAADGKPMASWLAHHRHAGAWRPGTTGGPAAHDRGSGRVGEVLGAANGIAAHANASRRGPERGRQSRWQKGLHEVWQRQDRADLGRDQAGRRKRNSMGHAGPVTAVALSPNLAGSSRPARAQQHGPPVESGDGQGIGRFARPLGPRPLPAWHQRRGHADAVGLRGWHGEARGSCLVVAPKTFVHPDQIFFAWALDA